MAPSPRQRTPVSSNLIESTSSISAGGDCRGGNTLNKKSSWDIIDNEDGRDYDPVSQRINSFGVAQNNIRGNNVSGNSHAYHSQINSFQSPGMPRTSGFGGLNMGYGGFVGGFPGLLGGYPMNAGGGGVMQWLSILNYSMFSIGQIVDLIGMNTQSLLYMVQTCHRYVQTVKSALNKAAIINWIRRKSQKSKIFRWILILLSMYFTTKLWHKFREYLFNASNNSSYRSMLPTSKAPSFSSDRPNS